MADQVTNYQCPACTGPLHFDGSSGRLKCDYCGSSFSVREIEELYAAKNEAAASALGSPAAEKETGTSGPGSAAGKEGGIPGANTAAGKEAGTSGPGPAAGEEAGTSGWGSDAAKMRAYNCTSCGAELICDETTAATSCPYCGNNTVIPGQFAGTLRPDWVIPFKKIKKEAVDALKGYYQGKILLPGSFSKTSHLEEVKGVYVPFWLYSGHVDARGSYDARNDEIFLQGEYQITRSRHYEAIREGTISFSRIPVDASSKMPDDLMDSIEPFDYSAITEFSLAYMPGYLANKYDVSQRECGRRADERARKTAQEALLGTVTGYSNVSTRTHEEKTHHEKTEYAVLPVWLLSTTWNGQNFLFAMNGQTGKMTGNLPVSALKQTVCFIAVFLLSFLVFGSFMLGGEDVDVTSCLITAVFAMILAAIVNFVLIAQMKPVAQESRAAAYVDHGGVRLHTRSDRFIRTTESRVRIQNRQPPGGGIPPLPRDRG